MSRKPKHVEHDEPFDHLALEVQLHQQGWSAVMARAISSRPSADELRPPSPDPGKVANEEKEPSSGSNIDRSNFDLRRTYRQRINEYRNVRERDFRDSIAERQSGC